MNFGRYFRDCTHLTWKYCGLYTSVWTFCCWENSLKRNVVILRRQQIWHLWGGKPTSLLQSLTSHCVSSPVSSWNMARIWRSVCYINLYLNKHTYTAASQFFFRCFRKVNIGMYSMHLNRDIQTVSIPCWWISFLQLWREFLWIGGDHKNFLKWKWSQSIPCSHSLRCFVARKELTEWYARWKLFDNSRNWYVPETTLSYSTELILDICKLQHLLRHLRKTCECRLQWFHSMFRNKKFHINFFTPCHTHRIFFEFKYSGDTELQNFLLFAVSPCLRFSLRVAKQVYNHPCFILASLQ